MKHAEVWLVDFAPKVGQKIDKVRPAIIANHDSMGALQLKVVVPITDAVRSIRDWHVLLHPSKDNGISKKVLRIAFRLNQSQRSDLLGTWVSCQLKKWTR